MIVGFGSSAVNENSYHWRENIPVRILATQSEILSKNALVKGNVRSGKWQRKGRCVRETKRCDEALPPSGDFLRAPTFTTQQGRPWVWPVGRCYDNVDEGRWRHTVATRSRYEQSSRWPSDELPCHDQQPDHTRRTPAAVPRSSDTSQQISTIIVRWKKNIKREKRQGATVRSLPE